MNAILLILSGEREIDRMLTPFGLIPNIENIENKSEITIESEKKYDAKEGEGVPLSDNLEKIKYKFENNDREDTDEDEDEVIDEDEVEDSTPSIMKEYVDENIKKQEPIKPLGFYKRIYTDFWGGSKRSY
jgi:hypothetical protein